MQDMSLIWLYQCFYYQTIQPVIKLYKQVRNGKV